MFVLACIAFTTIRPGVASSGTRDLPDARTWRFFGEKKLKPRLFFAVPGVSDSILVAEGPACCPVVAPNGRWVACTNWNSKAIESELLIVSREMDRWWPLRGYTVISYRWSPDGLSLVGYGKRRTAASVCFFAVDPVKRSAWFPDSISIPEDYDFAWDSTSHRVAICRPGSGTRDPARVLVYSLPDRKMTKLAALTHGTPSNPRWLPDGVLVVSKDRAASSDSSADLRFPLPER